MNKPVSLPLSKEALPADTQPATGRWIAGRRGSLLVGIALIIAISTLALGWWLLRSGSPLRYTTVPVSRGAVTRAVTTTGTVNPEVTVIVGSYVSGVIQQLFCDYNTEVKTGQVCAKIDDRPYQSVVDQARANLAIGKAQLQKDQASLVYAKLNFERNAKLVQTNAVSVDVYDNSKSNRDQAEAQIAFDEATIQQRQAELNSAQVNLDYTRIISPVDGTVVSRNVTQGQTVAASFQTPTLFLIASDLTKMQVDTNVSEGDIGGIKPNDQASFTVDAFPDRTFKGTVTQVRQSPQTVQNVVTYDVVIGVNNIDLALKPGMTAAVRIITDARDDVRRVPNQALRYRPARDGAADAGGHLWVLRGKKPAAISVKLGLSDDNFTEIESGDLQSSDQVIVGEQAAQSRASMSSPRF